MISAILLFLALPHFSFAQYESQKSKTIISILGNQFYVHMVKKGETLFTISKLYNTTVDDIFAYNPNIESNLANGQALKIPYVEDKNENQENVLNQTEHYIYHTVQRKQTLFAIAKKYNVDENDILRLNPDIKNGLKSGQVIRIPNQTFVSDKKSDEQYVFHKVEKKETLFSLAQRYNIDISEINAANPDITEGLKEGQIVRIPKKATDHQNSKNNDQNKLIPDVKPCQNYKYNPNQPFKVALLLPLFLNDNYVRSQNSDERSDKWFSKNTARFYEIYEGALMAIEYHRKQGLAVELFVYDTENDLQQIQNLIKKPELAKADLIIGPVYAETVKTMADFAKENKICIVSPLSQNDDLVRTNPFLFQVNPSQDTRIEQVCKFISQQSQTSVVAIHSGSPEELSLLNVYKRELTGSNNRVPFKEINFKQSGLGGLDDALSVGLNNIIVITSSNEVFVTDMVNKLYELSKKYNLTLMGMPSWEKFQNLDYNSLLKLKFHYPSSAYADYTKWNVKSFVTKYREYYKTDPTVFSFQGYDIMNYFLGALREFGPNFQYCIENAERNPDKNGLLLEFDFKKGLSSGGYKNGGVYILGLDEEMNLSKANFRK